MGRFKRASLRVGNIKKFVEDLGYPSDSEVGKDLILAIAAAKKKLYRAMKSWEKRVILKGAGYNLMKSIAIENTSPTSHYSKAFEGFDLIVKLKDPLSDLLDIYAESYGLRLGRKTWDEVGDRIFDDVLWRLVFIGGSVDPYVHLDEEFFDLLEGVWDNTIRFTYSVEPFPDDDYDPTPY